MGFAASGPLSFLWNGYPEKTWDALFTSSLISVQRLQNWDNGLITVGFLPASHKAVTSFYPSWQRVRVPGEGMGSRTAQRTPKYLSDVHK